jgi:hypothetical protein
MEDHLRVWKIQVNPGRRENKFGKAEPRDFTFPPRSCGRTIVTENLIGDFGPEIGTDRIHDRPGVTSSAAKHAFMRHRRLPEPDHLA